VAQVAEDCGYEPVLTASADQFREQLRAHRADAIAMDLGMPVDGVELLRLLASEKCTAPVLIISGFDRRVLESAFRLGEALGLKMIGPLEKPVRAEQLEKVLREMKASLVP
jgi:CheY-like chemotaxis protein